jgi:hypothetical protein
MGRFKEAISELLETLKICEKSFGRDHRYYSIVVNVNLI